MEDVIHVEYILPMLMTKCYQEWDLQKLILIIFKKEIFVYCHKIHVVNLVILLFSMDNNGFQIINKRTFFLTMHIEKKVKSIISDNLMDGIQLIFGYLLLIYMNI